MEHPKTPRGKKQQNANANDKGGGGGADPTRNAIEQIAARREARRKAAENYRKKREEEFKQNERLGKPGDVDFQRMIEDWRAKHGDEAEPHEDPGNLKICIAARKRPINEREIRSKDYDSVTCMNPRVVVHHPKYKVDGITKYLETQAFEFDHAFDENSTNEQIYNYTVLPLVAHVFQRGYGTCFAYGQTGSGKTYTMVGVQQLIAQDLFRMLEKEEYAGKGFTVHVAMFEIYGGRCSDLLHNRSMVAIREDGNNKVQAVGLKHIECESYDDLLEVIDRGNACRTTHKTAVNDVSSRSHAICEIQVRDNRDRVYGKLSLIDLAGSERAADRKHHNRQRRVESAEINKSLLALKECIRSIDNNNRHVPFRASKLTMVLKDSFTSNNSRVVMISTVSPNAGSSDHTQNTLRYADRIKEKPAHARGQVGGPVSSAGLNGPVSSDITYLQEPRLEEENDENVDKPETKNVKKQNDAARNGPPSGRHSGDSSSNKGSSPEETAPKKRPARRPARRQKPMVQTEDDDDGDVAADFNPLPNQRRQGNKGKPRGSGRDADVDEEEKTEEDYKEDDITAHARSRTPPQRHGGGGKGAAGKKGNKQKNGGESPVQKDVAYLAQTLREDGDFVGVDSERFLELNEAVTEVVQLEEDLLESHMSAIQENAEALTEEGQLLSKVQGDTVIDYDIDTYAERLEKILANKLKTTKSLVNKVRRFRKALENEEMVSRRIEQQNEGEGNE
eukprot:gb/GECG01007957.1/.p1 GENE.gb/GECG01007957.1/~~gb/GECG01007957.1/.p1  ORF type:complete len:733 (+),score=141.76 gb/GECG01007957.1/:1-2199(+)